MQKKKKQPKKSKKDSETGNNNRRRRQASSQNVDEMEVEEDTNSRPKERPTRAMPRRQRNPIIVESEDEHLEDLDASEYSQE